MVDKRMYFIRTLCLLVCGVSLAWAQNETTSTTTTASSSTTSDVTDDSGYKLKVVGDVPSGGSLAPLFKMARGFADAVGPKEPFIDDVVDMVSGNHTIKLPEEFDRIMKLVKMEAGFMACLVFGLLLFFGLGVGGTIFCCCRCCCRKCGANRVQKPKDDLDSRRKTYFSLLSVTLLFMTAAFICSYVSSVTLGDAVLDTEDKVIDILDDTARFFDLTSQQLGNLSKDGIHDAVYKVSKELNDTGDHFGNGLYDYAQKELTTISTLAEDLDNDINRLENTKTQLNGDIKRQQDDIKRKLEQVGQELTTIKRDCGEPCSGIETEGAKTVQIDTSSLNNLPTAQIQPEVLKFNSSLDGIPKNVSEKVQEKVNDLSTKIEEYERDFEKQDFFQGTVNDTANAVKFIPDTKKDVHKVFVDVKKYKLNLYYGMSGIVSLVSIPTLLICLGMCCGCAGHRSSRHPADRGGLSNCGGCTIITGVYLLFFITGIPILLTTLLFQLGGHVQVHLCSVAYEKDLKTFDKYFDIAKKEMKLDDKLFKDLQPSQTFKVCENGGTVYTALNLSSVFDIDKELDFESKLDLKTELGKFDFDISSQIGIDTAEIERKNADIQNINSDQINELKEKLLSGFVDGGQLEKWIADLTNIKDKLQAGKIKNDLTIQIGELNEIKDFLNGDFKKNWDKIVEEIKPVNATQMKQKGKEITERCINIPKSVEQGAKDIKDEFQNHLIGVANSSVDDIKYKITHEVGNCKQIWVIYDNSRQLFCRDILDPINGYWFSLGWVLFFSIFAIAFATKLSKHYMRMSDMKSQKWDGENLDPRDVAPTENQPCIPMKQQNDLHYYNGGFQTPPQSPPGYYPNSRNPYGPPPFPTQMQHPSQYDDRVSGYTKY